jgi:predicted ATP-binding protein involved in virulence
MIKIKNIHLKNFHGFTNVSVTFSDGVTCIAGINGAGKSSILDAVALCLSWIIARTKSMKGNGRVADMSLDLRSETSTGSVSADFVFNGTEFSMRQVISKLGTKAEQTSDYTGLAVIFNYVNNHIQVQPSSFYLPVLAYYPTERTYLDIPNRIRQHHTFEEFSTYDESLASSAKFRDFFEWYRNREDIENATKISKKDFSYVDSQLEAVRNAVYAFLPGCSNLKVERSPQSMFITKDEKKLPINVFSDGEKCLLSLVGDLARRLSIANPGSANPLSGDGIVLIDEVDLHLHPAWQRNVTESLVKTFPNCQFIITTHSPQVLGEIQPENIRLLNNYEISIPEQSYGLDSNTILDTLQSTDNKKYISQNEQVKDALHEISILIDKEEYDAARTKLNELEEKLHGHTPDTLGAATAITVMEGSVTVTRAGCLPSFCPACGIP